MCKQKNISIGDFFRNGNNKSERRDFMNFKGLALSMGLGVAVGAVAIMMMPSSNPARKLASKAANKVEDTAWRISDKMAQEFNM